MGPCDRHLGVCQRKPLRSASIVVILFHGLLHDFVEKQTLFHNFLCCDYKLVGIYLTTLLRAPLKPYVCLRGFPRFQTSPTFHRRECEVVLIPCHVALDVLIQRPFLIWLQFLKAQGICPQFRGSVGYLRINVTTICKERILHGKLLDFA